jgi:hypothetical protein
MADAFCSRPVWPPNYPLAVLVFLGSSGSAFWTGIVSYVKQVKDVNEAKKQELRLNNLAKAQSMSIMHYRR